MTNHAPTTRQLIALATYKEATKLTVDRVADIDLRNVDSILTRATITRLIKNDWDGRSELKL